MSTTPSSNMHASAGDNIGNASGTDSVGNEQQQQQEDFRSMAKKSDQPTSVPKDKHSVTKRLQQELLSLMMSGENGVSAFPDGDNLFRWIGTISGPIGTVYEGLEYRLILEFPNGYPIAAPRVRFETSCFHPNVDESGNICLDILREKWSATYDVLSILLSIQSLLADPNIASALNHQAAELWKNQVLFKKHLLDKYEKEAHMNNKQQQ